MPSEVELEASPAPSPAAGLQVQEFQEEQRQGERGKALSRQDSLLPLAERGAAPAPSGPAALEDALNLLETPEVREVVQEALEQEHADGEKETNDVS